MTSKTLARPPTAPGLSPVARFGDWTPGVPPSNGSCWSDPVIVVNDADVIGIDSYFHPTTGEEGFWLNHRDPVTARPTHFMPYPPLPRNCPKGKTRFPDKVGFWQYRKAPEHPWEMCEVRSFGSGNLSLYSASGKYGGYSLSAQHTRDEFPGEWVFVNTPS